MKVLVCGSSGCIGSAVVRALRSRGHVVVAGARRDQGGLRVDFMAPVAPADWATLLLKLRIDAVVNCAGILREQGGQTYERVHAQGPAELFRGAALAGLGPVVQVSALGPVRVPAPGPVPARSPDPASSPYLATKHAADEALRTALPATGTVLRPSLVVGPGSDATRLFATLAALPLVALPGGGRQWLAPLHVYELAEIVARCVERPAPGVHELGGGDVLGYRQMLAAFRATVGAGPALALPLPMVLMHATAWLAEALPQRVLCRQTIRLLAAGSVPADNAAARLLGRAPSTLAAALSTTPPRPLLPLRVTLDPPVRHALQAALAAMWLWTALVSAAWPQGSGVLALLARCGFEGTAGLALLAASCLLNGTLGLLTVLRPGPAVYALQIAAIAGYTAVAAWHVPALAIDHCGPLVKNLPLAAMVLVLWLAGPPMPSIPPARRSAAPRWSRGVDATTLAPVRPEGRPT